MKVSTFFSKVFVARERVFKNKQVSLANLKLNSNHLTLLLFADVTLVYLRKACSAKVSYF